MHPTFTQKRSPFQVETTTMIAFVSSSLLPANTTKRTCHIFMGKNRSSGRPKSRSSKPKKSQKPVVKSSPSSSSSPPSLSSSKSSKTPEDSSEVYIPRGPTLRAEYERKGLIEPLPLDRDAGVLPEKVANRMIRRIVAFGGIPLTFLFSFFALYFVLKYRYDITVLPVVVASSTLGTIGFATAGITYGILSSSWDEEEGSLLGWTEFKLNFLRARDGLVGAREREKKEDELDRIDQLAEDIEKENETNTSE